MHFLDPDRGRARRARARDQLAARLRRRRQEIEKGRRYAEGVAEGVRHHGPEHRPADDQALVDRVKSQLGPALPLDRINLDALDGVIELRGEVESPARIEDVVRAVAGVPGVDGVTNLLHVPGTPAPPRPEGPRPSST